MVQSDVFVILKVEFPSNELRADYDNLAKDLVVAISAVEASFYHSMRALPSATMVKKIRQEGWLSLGSYVFKASKEKELEHKMVTGPQ